MACVRIAAEYRTVSFSVAIWVLKKLAMHIKKTGSNCLHFFDASDVSDSSSEGQRSGSVTTDGRDRIFFTASLSHLLPHSLLSLGESERTQGSLSTWRRAAAEG